MTDDKKVDDFDLAEGEEVTEEIIEELSNGRGEE
jgi:hypothetical protein